MDKNDELTRLAEILERDGDEHGVGAKLREIAERGKAGGVAWECTGQGLKKYVTDKQYQVFTPGVHRWYKPYRCTNCEAIAPQPKDAT